MAIETMTFKGELERIEKARQDFLTALLALRKFILSAAFLVDFIQFETLLGDFEDKIVTLVVEVENPVEQLGLPPYEAVKPASPEQLIAAPSQPGKWDWWRFAALIFVVVASYVAADNRVISFLFFEAILVSGLVLMFMPQIANLVHGLFRREEEEEAEKASSVRLEDWVQETVDSLRKTYRSARFLVKVQTQTKENLPQQYTSLNIDEAMYNRNKQFLETLPHDFNSQLGKIRAACDKNCWQRKQTVISAIVAARQSVNAMMPRGSAQP